MVLIVYSETTQIGGKLGIEFRFLTDFLALFPGIEDLSVDAKEHISASPFAPIPIEEISKLENLRSLELVSFGAPLAGLGKLRGSTLRNLVLINSLVSAEDLASLLDSLDRCDKLLLQNCRTWARTDDGLACLQAAVDRHSATLKELQLESIRLL